MVRLPLWPWNGTPPEGRQNLAILFRTLMETSVGVSVSDISPLISSQDMLLPAGPYLLAGFNFWLSCKSSSL